MLALLESKNVNPTINVNPKTSIQPTSILNHVHLPCALSGVQKAID